MKIYLTFIAIFLLVACKLETKDNSSTTAKNETNQEVAISNNSGADYSSLFKTYTCDVSSTDLAKILQIPVSDIGEQTSESSNKCLFKIKGFGEGHDDTGTTWRLMLVPSSKGQNKKEITALRRDKAELPSGILMGRDIVLADAGDCYISSQPKRGKVRILNENYDRFILITYQTKGSVKGRTEALHDQLNLKVKDLANHLVTTHKK